MSPLLQYHKYRKRWIFLWNLTIWKWNGSNQTHVKHKRDPSDKKNKQKNKWIDGKQEISAVPGQKKEKDREKRA